MHQARFGGLGPQAQGWQQIGAQIHRQDLQHGQGRRDLEGHHGQKGRHFGHVAGQHVGQKLADIGHHTAAVAHRRDDRGEIVVEQHHIGGLPSHIGALQTHGHTHIGGPQCRRIVDPIAGDGHHLAEGAICLHQPQLLLGRHAGKNQAGAVFEQLAQLHIADPIEMVTLDHPHWIGLARCGGWPAIASWGIEQADLAGDGLGREAIVTGNHRHLDAGLVALADGLRHLGPGRVIEPDQPHQGELPLQQIRRSSQQAVI